MASPAILFRGSEVDSVYPISGSLSGTTSDRDAEWSAAGISLNSSSSGQIFRESNGTASSVDSGDDLWVSFYLSKSSGASGTAFTVFDNLDRPSFRVLYSSGLIVQLQHNTSSTATPTWVALSSYETTGFGGYISFKIRTGPSKNFSFYIGGSLISDGPFTNALIGSLSRFSAGPFNTLSGISQIVVTRGLPIVGARLQTRKANAAGTYSQMTGAFGNLVKTTINDTTGVSSSVGGQVSTFNYQDTVVPDGLEMHPEIAVWSRARNDGSAPTMFKPAYVVDGVLQKGASIMLDIGFSAIPYVISGMTPAKFNACEIGMESSDL